jgi:adenylate kinase family enzyme
MFSNIAIVGSVRAGKTTLQTFLVEQMVTHYAKCIVLSPNVRTDEKWQALKMRYGNKMILKTSISNKMLDTIILNQRTCFEKDVNDTLLLCIDDFGSGAKYRKDYGESLDSLVTKYRWTGTTLISSFHAFKQMSVTQRLSVSHWLLFRTSDVELKKMTPELRAHLTDEGFRDFVHRSTIEPFSFAYINMRAATTTGVFHTNVIG